MFFIITVIQQWMNDYLQKVIHFSSENAVFVFLIVAVTALPTGIIIGGIIVQKLGGYSSIKATYMIIINSGICSLIAVAFAFVTNKVGFIVLTWPYLFLGASIVPCLAGAIVASIPLELKGSGCSLYFISVNLLGFAPAPTVYGLLDDIFSKTTPTLPISISFGFAFIGFCLMNIVLCIRQSHINKINKEEENFFEEESDIQVRQSNEEDSKNSL